jgi:hypothetical protein
MNDKKLKCFYKRESFVKTFNMRVVEFFVLTLVLLCLGVDGYRVIHSSRARRARRRMQEKVNRERGREFMKKCNYALYKFSLDENTSSVQPTFYDGSYMNDLWHFYRKRCIHEKPAQASISDFVTTLFMMSVFVCSFWGIISIM